MPEFDPDTWETEDTPMPEVADASASYSPPVDAPPLPSAGVHTFKIAGIPKEPDLIGSGHRFSVNLAIVGGVEDGRLATFVPITNLPTFNGRIPFVDFAKAAGVDVVPDRPKEQAQLLKRLKESGQVFKARGDWKAFCMRCAVRALVKELNLPENEAVTKFEAMRRNGGDEFKKVNSVYMKAGQVARSASAFPERGGDARDNHGKPYRNNVLTCPECTKYKVTSELIGKYFIRTWIAPKDSSGSTSSGAPF